MRRFHSGLAMLAVLAAGTAMAESPQPPAPTAYADLADLALAAPIAAHVRVVGAAALSKEQAAAARPGFALFYVEADLVALIRAPQSLPTRISFLAEMPLGPGGKAVKPKKGAEMLIFARPVAGQPGAVQLAAPDAAILYSPSDSERLRAILREADAGNAAPPRITGIGKAFHVPGSLPGEGETQIFLQTADSRPVSLSVLRRPGETMRWSVALSEIVDDSAAPPARDTLLWYRLACSLPPTLPPQSLAEASPEEAAAIREDYNFIMTSLGPCGRTRRG